MTTLDQPDGAQPVPMQPTTKPLLSTEKDFRDAQMGAETRQAFDKAVMEDDQPEIDAGVQRMEQQASQATMEVVIDGGDPARETRSIGMFLSQGIEMGRQQAAMQQRQDQFKSFLSEDPELGEVRDYMFGILEEYKKQNEAELPEWSPATMTPEQRFDYMSKLQPVSRDPNEVAEMRSKMVSINNRMREIDPSFNLWTNPQTGQWASWMNREAGETGAGYFKSGEQQIELGLGTRLGIGTIEAMGSLADMPLNFVWQMAEWNNSMLEAVSMDPISLPLNYIQGPDGKFYVNQEQPHPGLYQAAVATWAQIIGKNVVREVAMANRVAALEQNQRRGFTALTHGIANFVGAMKGFSPTFGVGKAIGQASMGKMGKGLAYLGGARSARAQQFIGTWAGHLGSAAGFGAMQSTAYGKQQGFFNQFLHGAALYPALLVMGHLGPRIEKALKGKKMPPKVAQMLAEGVAVGLPFGVIEHATGGLWEHLKDPNASTLDIYLKNFLGAALFKGWQGGRALTLTEEAMVGASFHVERSRARAAFAEDMANGRTDPGVLAAKFPKVNVADLQALGELILRRKASEDPVERQELYDQQREMERNLDVTEFGLDESVAMELQDLVAEQRGEAPEEVAMQPEAAPVERRFTERRTYQVPGKEPGPIRDPRAERRQAERRQKHMEERLDPLEEIDYMDRPESERRIIAQAKDAAERKRVAQAFEEGAERFQVSQDKSGLWSVIDTRTGEAAMTGHSSRRLAEKWAATRMSTEQAKKPPTEAGMAVGPSTRMPSPQGRRKGARYGPGSMQTPEQFPLEAQAGAKQTNLDEIFGEMTGRLPRKGFRIPFTEKRIGGRPGSPVRVGLRKGRISKKGAEGLFKLFENLIRTRGGRDLVVMAHEWSHAMQRHLQSGRGGTEFLEAANRWLGDLTPAQRAEFEVILEGYFNWEALQPVSQGMEVWAEWHARELLGDTRLEMEAPLMTKLFREQLALPANKAVREQFMRIKGKIRDYQDIGAAGRVRASRVHAKDLASETMWAIRPTRYEAARDKVLTGFFDDIVKLKRSQEKWLEAARVDPAELGIMEDPARMWDALRLVAPKQVEHFVMRGLTDSQGRHIPGMESVMKKVGKGERMEDFKDYLMSVLNAQRLQARQEQRKAAMARGEKPPPEMKATTSMADYVYTLKQLSQKHPDFKELSRELKTWTDAIVDWIAGAGNLSADAAERIKDAYVVWVPFFRVMEGSAGRTGGGAGRAAAPVRPGVSRVKAGGSERIEDPLMAMFFTLTQMVANAHRNMIMSAIYKMSLGGEAGGFASKVQPDAVPTDHPLREILKAMAKQLKIPSETEFYFEDMVSALEDAGALDSQTVTLFAQKAMPTGRDIIAYTPRLTEAEIVRTARGDAFVERMLRDQNTKPVWLQVDPAIYETLVGLDVPPVAKFFDSNLLGQSLRGAANLRRFFATGISIPFIVRNVVRDILQQPIFDQEGGFAPMAGVPRFIKGAIAYHGQRGPGSIRDLYDMMGVKISSFFNQSTRKVIVGESRSLIETTMRGLEKIETMFATPENYLRIHQFEKVYEGAKADGKTEIEARLLALEAGKEITVNFARGGIAAKLYNPMTPYFNAGLQGQRKLWRQLLFGGDGRNDAERSRIQRNAWMNGLANITAPSMLMWWLNHDQEWYQDLPSWRKLGFFNFKISDDFILSLPKPFEAGILFGGIPETMMEMWVNENGTPPNFSDIMFDGLFPYLRGPGEFLPALIQPIIEIGGNFDWWRRRPLTPQWLRDNRIPEEQATLYTTEVSKILSSALYGKLTPIEIEHLLGGYTARMGTQGLKAIDEIFQLKNHPGLSVNPLQSFFPTQHRQGYFQQELYDISDILNRRAGSGVATGSELALRSQVNRVKSQFSRLSRSIRMGTAEASEIERRKFELARPLVERYQKLQESR